VVTFNISFYFDWFYGGADFERQIFPAHRSVPIPTTSRSRSAHAPLTCSESK